MKTMRTKYFAIIMTVLILVIVSSLTIFRKDIMYFYAVQNYKYENYSEAREVFDDLAEFKDSEQRYLQSTYMVALDLFSNKQYDEAKSIFSDLGDYESSKAFVLEADYLKAIDLLNNMQFEEAKELFIQLGNHENSVNYAKECDYQIAIELYATGEVEKAKTKFVSLGKYLDSSDYVNSIDYLNAMSLLSENKLDEAKTMFLSLCYPSDYKDSCNQYYELLVNPKIGDLYKGGIIGYILKPGDSGYVKNEVHGLIVAIEGSVSSWYPFGANISDITGTLTTLGSGKSNTKKIIAYYGQDKRFEYAAFLCDVFTLGGYDDWYLPSRDELIKLYQNKDLIGGFENYPYWSSSDGGHRTVLTVNFEDGHKIWMIKNFGEGAARADFRPIRSF